MMILIKHRCNRICIRIAVSCFVIATLLMLLSLINNDFQIVFLAALILFTPVTMGMLLLNSVITLTHMKDLQEHFMTLILVLLNLPIGVLYVMLLPF